MQDLRSSVCAGQIEIPGAQFCGSSVFPGRPHLRSGGRDGCFQETLVSGRAGILERTFHWKRAGARVPLGIRTRRRSARSPDARRRPRRARRSRSSWWHLFRGETIQRARARTRAPGVDARHALRMLSAEGRNLRFYDPRVAGCPAGTSTLRRFRGVRTAGRGQFTGPGPASRCRTRCIAPLRRISRAAA